MWFSESTPRPSATSPFGERKKTWSTDFETPPSNNQCRKQKNTIPTGHKRIQIWIIIY